MWNIRILAWVKRNELRLKFLGAILVIWFLYLVFSSLVFIQGKLIYHNKGYICAHYCLNTSGGCQTINTVDFENITKKWGENFTYLGIKRMHSTRMDLLCGTDSVRLYLG